MRKIRCSDLLHFIGEPYKIERTVGPGFSGHSVSVAVCEAGSAKVFKLIAVAAATAKKRRRSKDLMRRA